MSEFLIDWIPGRLPSSSLGQPSVSWLINANARELELAGVDSHGRLWWNKVKVNDQGEMDCAVQTARSNKQYQAATLLGPNRLAAVTASHIHLYQTTATGRLHKTKEIEINRANAIACFPHLTRVELVVVCGDGAILQVPLG